jgi:hypothetical protein
VEFDCPLSSDGDPGETEVAIEPGGTEPTVGNEGVLTGAIEEKGDADLGVVRDLERNADIDAGYLAERDADVAAEYDLEPLGSTCPTCGSELNHGPRRED